MRIALPRSACAINKVIGRVTIKVSLGSAIVSSERRKKILVSTSPIAIRVMVRMRVVLKHPIRARHKDRFDASLEWKRHSELVKSHAFGGTSNGRQGYVGHRAWVGGLRACARDD
jgi:hypothetical protein